MRSCIPMHGEHDRRDIEPPVHGINQHRLLFGVPYDFCHPDPIVDAKHRRRGVDSPLWYSGFKSIRPSRISSARSQIYVPKSAKRTGTTGRTTNVCHGHLSQLRWSDAVLDGHKRVLVQFILLVVVNVVRIRLPGVYLVYHGRYVDDRRLVEWWFANLMVDAHVRTRVTPSCLYGDQSVAKTRPHSPLLPTNPLAFIRGRELLGTSPYQGIIFSHP